VQNILEKFGSFGAIVAAAVCPICFPKLALFGAMLGLGALAKFETTFFFGAQILVILAIIGHVVSYKKHKNGKLLSLAAVSAILLFVSLYAYVSELLSYLAFSGLIVATIWLVIENRRCSSCVTASE